MDNFAIMTDDILKEIPVDDLNQFCELFDQNYSKHIYYFINNYIDWIGKDPNTKIKFFAVDGDWKDGTFIAIIEEGIYHITLFTFEKTCERLKNALMETKLIDWARGPLLNYIHHDHASVVTEVLKTKNLEVAAETFSTIYRIDAEHARLIDVECPNDVYVTQLTKKDARIIDDNWIYKFQGSIEYIEKLIAMNGGVGIFGKEDNAVRAWVLIYDTGGLGVLHTLDDYRKRGYGKIVVAALTKQLGVSGKDGIALISEENLASRKLFESVGYKFVDKCRWFFILDTINYSNKGLKWK